MTHKDLKELNQTLTELQERLIKHVREQISETKDLIEGTLDRDNCPADCKDCQLENF